MDSGSHALLTGRCALVTALINIQFALCLDLAAAGGKQIERATGQVDGSVCRELNHTVAAHQANTVSSFDGIARGGAVGFGAADQHGVVVAHYAQVISANRHRLVVPDALVAVMPYGVAFVHFDDDVLIPLGMDIHLLQPLLVLHADFIEVGRRAALARTTFHAALGRVLRQIVGHRLLRVIHPPGNDRPVRVAFQKAHNHLLADPWDLHRASVLAGPGLRHAYPARAVFVGLVVAVPVKMHLHAAVLVGPDFFAFGADYQGGLRAFDDGAIGVGQRAEVLLGVDAGEAAFVLRRARTAAAFQAFLMDVVADANDQVFAVLVLAAEAGEAEQVAVTEAAGVAAEFDLFMQGLQGFDAGARVVFAVFALHVGAGVVVQRIVAGGVRTRHGRAHVDARAGALEVVVVELQRARLHLLRQVPVVHVVAFALLLVLGVVRNRRIARHRGVGAVGVGQHQHVAVLFMAEEVVNAFLFHQAADEIEAGFAVLHAVFPLAVRPAQGVFEVGKTQVAEHLLDDLRDAQVLENPAVRRAAQQPQPRAQRHLVAGELALVDALAALRDDAVEMPLATVRQLHADAHRLAQQLVEVDVGVQGGQLQVVSEQPAQLFAAAHLIEQQHVRPEGAGDFG